MVPSFITLLLKVPTEIVPPEKFVTVVLKVPPEIVPPEWFSTF